MWQLGVLFQAYIAHQREIPAKIALEGQAWLAPDHLTCDFPAHTLNCPGRK